MKKYCLILYCKKLFLHTHCYFSYNDKMYFNIYEIPSMFNNTVHIILASDVSQRRYSYRLKNFGSYIQEGKNIYIEKDLLLRFFPILFDFYTNTIGHNKISKKLLYFYTYLKNRMNYNIE